MTRRIFLAHAREDKEQVRTLYDELKARGLDPWLDEVDLVPGQIWKDEISNAIRDARVFLACLSSQSVGKVSYLQNEFRIALSAFGERPPGSIYIIPVRLDECKVPDLTIPDRGLSFKDIHWVDLWEEEGIVRLVDAIKRAQETSHSAEASGDNRGSISATERLFEEAQRRVSPKVTKEREIVTDPQSEERVVKEPNRGRKAILQRLSRWQRLSIIGAIATITGGLLGLSLIDQFFGNGKQEIRANIAASPSINTATEAEKLATFSIFWVTDRKETGKAAPADMFGGQRGPLIYGTSEISVPHEHEVGRVEQPSYWRFEFRNDPSRHMILLPGGTEISDKDPWFRAVKERAEKGARTAFVFIHGFNTTFEEAALRTAQIGYDLRFPGAPILYSWPSKGSIAAYTADEINVQWSEPHLVAFLKDLHQKVDADDITLIAHSMGSRLLGNALETLSSELPSDTRPFFNEIILSAPDIDPEIFRTQVMPAMLRLAEGRTLYASSDDWALTASQNFHRDGSSRAGEAGEHIIVMPGLDTIDASEFRTDFFAHSDTSDRSILADMFYIVREGKRASERGLLQEQQTEDGAYWRLVP